MINFDEKTKDVMFKNSEKGIPMDTSIKQSFKVFRLCEKLSNKDLFFLEVPINKLIFN